MMKMEKTKVNVQDMAMTALMAAVLAVLSPWSIPIGPVPVSLGLFGVYLAALLLGPWKGTLSVLIYLLLGFVGLPVFSGFSGGPQRILGPTGGFLVGYLPLALLIGLLSDALLRKKKVRYSFPLLVVGMAAATLLLYALGTLWLMAWGKYPFAEALGLAVVPFVPFDLAKLLVAAAIAPVIRARVRTDL